MAGFPGACGQWEAHGMRWVRPRGRPRGPSDASWRSCERDSLGRSLLIGTVVRSSRSWGMSPSMESRPGEVTSGDNARTHGHTKDRQTRPSRPVLTRLASQLGSCVKVPSDWRTGIGADQGRRPRHRPWGDCCSEANGRRAGSTSACGAIRPARIGSGATLFLRNDAGPRDIR